MRFASLGASNAANYAGAGKAVADSAANVFDVQRKTGPDYAKLSQIAMVTNAEEKITAMKTAAKVTEQGIKNLRDKTKMQHGIAVFNDKKERFQSKRKAGAIAGLGQLAGAAFLATRNDNRKRPTNSKEKGEVLNAHLKKMQGLYDQMDANDQKGLNATNALINNGSNNSSGTATGGNASGKAPTGGSTGSPSSGTDHLVGLTDKDFHDMAYTISSEAALGTDDVFGVAANLVTRLKSGKYGSSIHEISHAPGQYEGVYTGRSVASPDIAAQLMSPEGRSKINRFVDRLGGRTEFKGQSMLHNRVASEDPMFDPKGNFYHFAGQ